MRVFRDIILKIFALCILVFSIVLILSVANIIDIDVLVNKALALMSENTLVTIGLCALVAILAVIGIFARVYDEDELKSGIAIKREQGSVYIAKETFESIVANVVKSFASLKNFKTIVNIGEEGITASVFTYILPNTVVPTITAKLQEDIKDAILKQTTVELKEVNIKVKGVYNQVEKAPSTSASTNN